MVISEQVKKDFRNLKISQFDGNQALKGSFSELKSAFRTYSLNGVLKDVYSYFNQEVNVNGLPTKVEYFKADVPFKYKILLVDDVNNSLAGVYFSYTSSITKTKVTYYYEVSGNGSAPLVDGLVEKIAIDTNDSASVIAQLTRLKLKEYTEQFQQVNVKQFENVYILVEEFGADATLDVSNSPFTLTVLQEGVSRLVGTIELNYDANNNSIYNGNTLKGLKFNPYTASFEITDIDTTAVNFSVQNINIPLANVETVINIPNGTKTFRLKSKEPGTRILIARSSGGATYTVPYGAEFTEENKNTSGVTLYVQTTRDNKNLELLTWF